MERQQSSTRRHRKLDLKLVIIILLALISLALLLIIFIAKPGYNQGKDDLKQGISEDLENLTDTLIAKNSLQDNLASLTVSEFNDDSLKTYAEGLDNLIASADSEIKPLLEEYQQAFLDFESVYNAKDNDKISEALEELKTKAADLAKNLTDFYNQKLTKNLESLRDF